jgi:NAD(P)H-dependent flavin oxidoreductase YrpB (nitropropane dioxygenase family)
VKTDLYTRLGIELPIVLAPMGGAVGPQLTAAVSNAGGLGMIPLWYLDADTIRASIKAVLDLTDKPFGVNLNLNWPQDERLALCLDEGVTIVSTFWGDPGDAVTHAHRGGAIVFHTAGSAEEARRAADAGADVIVAQGWEAGGHVRGTVATMALVPAVVDAVAPLPVVAAGGIADGRGLAAALALGASAAWIGTRFLASPESIIHARYRERVVEASADNTYYSRNLYNVGWPDAPHRVLRNKTVDAWEAAGSPAPGARPGEGEVVATSPTAGDAVRYSISAPIFDTTGDIDALPMWSGQGVGLVRREQAAGKIVKEIADEARDVIRRLANF